MTRQRRHVFLCAMALLLVCGCASTPRIERAPRKEAFDPLVMVFARFPGRMQIGNGFAVGDGSHIVTARHLIFEKSHKGGAHSMGGLVTVVSPWLGDGCEATVVFEDAEVDLAVLRTPWRGHPAYAIADDRAVRRARELWIAGLDNVEYVDGVVPEPPGPLGDIGAMVLGVRQIAERNGTLRVIDLSKPNGLRQGWSGSPILLPEATAAAGCFTQVTGHGEHTRENITGACGPALARIAGLVGDAVAPARRPTNAREAFLAYLETLRAASRFDHEAELRNAQAFIRLRPENAFGYRMAGKAARKLGRDDLAKELSDKALARDPEGPVTRLLIARSLQDAGNDDEALRLLEDLSASGNAPSFVVIYWANHLAKRGDNARCAAVLTQALEHEPDNAYLWHDLAGCRRKMGDVAGADAAKARAEELMPGVNWTHRLRR